MKKTNKKSEKRHKSSHVKRRKTKKKDIFISNKITNKTNICSPTSNKLMNEYTCYTKDILIQLRDLWNMRHSDVQINTSDNKEIHRLLSLYLKNVCNKESCWLKQKIHFGEIQNEYKIKDLFAPFSPIEWNRNPNEWLSSIDIINVMKQYENAYKCFNFIGPTPIDFDKRIIKGNRNSECVWDELCNFDISQQIKEGKTKIGVIFNTDTHDKSGQHWISLFINIKKKFIFYFDSSGDKMPNEIRQLIDRIINQGQECEPKIQFKIDTTKGISHQKGDSECGIYSLFFIINMLEDKLTRNRLKTHIFTDKYVNLFRKIYFNQSLDNLT